MMLRSTTTLGLACALALTASPGVAQDPIEETPEGVVLDFQDADLRVVLAALAEAGGLNVVYGDVPARRVTLRMSRPVPPDQVMSLLRSVARSNGLALSEDEDGLITLTSVGTAEPATAGAAADASQVPPRLFVYRLRHARAAQLASTLQSVFGGGGGRPGSAGPGGQGGRSFPPPLSQGLREQALPPVDTSAPDVVATLGEQQTPGIPADLVGDVLVVPDEITNSLLVRAAPADWAMVEEIIQTLDLRPLQVLIEVVIAEMRRTTDLDIGLSAGADRTDGETQTEIEIGAAGSASRSAGDLVLEVIRAGRTDVRGFFSALATEGTVRVLSRPVLLAQNNQEARILIGDERPFIQVFRSLPTDAAVRDQVVQYRDVGTVLTILPTINADGYVNLQLTQEVSTATAETQFGAPVISTREASTQLFVRGGQTVVIGGLIDRQENRTESGVPILKDIPLLGNLFKSQSRSVDQSELFLFLTPHIISDDEEADALRQRMEQRVRDVLPDTSFSGRR